MICCKSKLTSIFSFTSRASLSFLSRSFIARSLMTHAAAPFAASSGLDLFFKRSVQMQQRSANVLLVISTAYISQPNETARPRDVTYSLGVLLH